MFSSEFRAALRSDYWSVADATVILSELRRSGLSQAAFARQHGLRANRLARWRGRLRDEAAGGGGGELQLLPVRVLHESPPLSPPEAPFFSLDVVVAGGRTVRVRRSGFDADLLRDVVLTLEGIGPC